MIPESYSIDKALNYLRDKYGKAYEVITINLATTRSNVLYNLRGKVFQIISSTGDVSTNTISVKFNDVTNDAIPFLVYSRFITPFDKVYITNLQQTGIITILTAQEVEDIAKMDFFFNIAYPIPTTKGGTGLASYTAGNLIYYTSGTAFTKLAIGAAGTYLKSTGSAPAWASLTKTSANAVTSLSSSTAITYLCTTYAYAISSLTPYYSTFVCCISYCTTCAISCISYNTNSFLSSLSYNTADAVCCISYCTGSAVISIDFVNQTYQTDNFIQSLSVYTSSYVTSVSGNTSSAVTDINCSYVDVVSSISAYTACAVYCIELMGSYYYFVSSYGTGSFYNSYATGSFLTNVT